MTRLLPELVVGALSRPELTDALARGGVRFNAAALTLLDSPVFDTADVEAVRPVEIEVTELGLPEGGTHEQIVGAARHLGLGLCPPATAPYLRLAMLHQQSAPDSILSNGKAPSGSITVAGTFPRPDDAYPRGFYLRVVDDVPWLRGYHCADEYVWSPGDRLVFRA